MFQKDTKATNEKEKIYIFCSKVFLHLIWFWHDLYWMQIKEEEWPIHGWAKPLKSFFGAARPNWDQLGWVAPLHNIVLASVGPMVCCSHWYKSLLVVRPHQNFPRDLLRLNVARNSLNEVPSEALLQLKNLNQLDLSFNKIKYIEENTFAGKFFMRFQNVSYWICGTSS